VLEELGKPKLAAMPRAQAFEAVPKAAVQSRAPASARERWTAQQPQTWLQQRPALRLSPAPLNDGMPKAVVACLASAGAGRFEGLSFDELCKHLAPAPPEVVGYTLEALVDAGDVYSTMDDDHFQLV